jgi:hypothetical protein
VWSLERSGSVTLNELRKRLELYRDDATVYFLPAPEAQEYVEVATTFPAFGVEEDIGGEKQMEGDVILCPH